MNYIGIQAKDILLAESHEILLIDGDFALTDSQVMWQNQSFVMVNECDKRVVVDVLSSNLGQWRRTPLVGVNLINWIEGPVTPHNRDIIGEAIKNSLSTSGYFTVKKARLNADFTLTISMLRNKA